MPAKKTRVRVALGRHWMRVEIDGLPHLMVRRRSLHGVQSWKEGHPAHSFHIELSTSAGEINASYDNEAVWAQVLDGLRTALCAPREG